MNCLYKPAPLDNSLSNGVNAYKKRRPGSATPLNLYNISIELLDPSFFAIFACLRATHPETQRMCRKRIYAFPTTL